MCRICLKREPVVLAIRVGLSITRAYPGQGKNFLLIIGNPLRTLPFLMKQLFPILVAIIATTLILVMYINKDGRQWSQLEEEEQKRRLAWLTISGVIILAICSIIFLIGTG